MCATLRGLHELRFSNKGAPLPAQTSWQEHRLISNSIQPLNRFQYHFSSYSQKQVGFPVLHHHCCQSFPVNPTSEALAAKHLTPGQFPSGQKFSISRETSPFPWIWLQAARCGCSCIHCFEQDRDQITLESRPEQAFAIYKLII